MRYANGSLVTPFFLSLAVTLKFDVNIFLPEESNQLFCNFDCFRLATMHQCRCHRTLIAAGQTDQAGRILFQVLERRCTFALGCLPHLEPGNQLTEVLVSGARAA